MWPVNLQTYRTMLKLAAERGRTIKYTEIEETGPLTLWRHDCDMSLHRARRIAEIDAEYGVLSTFFILPHSDFYNILELAQTKIIREIVEMGHEVGLHLDVEYHLATSSTFDFETAIKKDLNLLEDVAEKKIDVFSYHNPTQDMLKFDSDSYADLINCYSRTIKENIDYGSDSNGYWRHQAIPEILQDSNKTRIQILTHPEWWIEDDYSPRDRVLRCAYGRAHKVMLDYDTAMSAYSDRENIKSDDLSLSDNERAIRMLQHER
jgi:peptidoglycan/xylan/chitin deacetylase (PgdA/CDA1 family)